LRQRLREHRLVTLQGAGGLGKTRLAREVAASLLDAFADGVWLVELAAVADPELVPAVVAATLGARDDGRGSASDALRTHVADRSLLIVLDNCEHLVAACARLARELLEAGPGLRILATSREPLRVLGEQAMVLPPLGMPPAGFRADDPALGNHEAIRLFCERAAAVQPAFALTPANASDVVDICRRLDGIALAIELAAARIRTLSPAAIRNGLDDRFRLLTKGDATALPRQRTLRALIDWSYELLDRAEGTLFRRLSVFAGSFSREAVLAIASDDALDRDAADDALHRLVEKSLVALDLDSGRFRLLETVREYARGKLDAAGELAPLRTRHLRHFVTFAETERPRLMGPAQGEAMTALDAERENFLAAHAWCGEAPGGAELDLRLAYALKLYWVNRGLPRVGYGLAVEALARPDAQARTFLRCRGLTDAGLLGFLIGEYDAVAGYLSESLSIARKLGDERRIVGALQPLGMTYLALGDRPRARECLVEALERASALGDPRELAAANNALAQLYRVDGAPERAAPLFDRVVALARQVDDRESIAVGLLNLAMVLVDAGALDKVPALLREVADIAAETGSKAAAQCVLDVCAGLASRQGEFAVAARFLARGEALCREMGMRRDPADAAFVATAVARVRAAAGAFVEPAGEENVPSWRAALGDARAWLDAGAGQLNPN
jgi:predicted ATPase